MPRSQLIALDLRLTVLVLVVHIGEMPESVIRHEIPSAHDEPRWYVWVLGAHREIESGERTYLGDLLARAKYNDDVSAIRELAKEVASAVELVRELGPRHVGFAGVQSVVAVPFRPGKRQIANSVPHMVASIASSILGIPNLSESVRRIDRGSEAKRGGQASADWFRCSADVSGQRVLIADDLLRTGGTLRAVAKCLRLGGADSVVGLCVTRAYGGLVSR